MFEVGFWFGGFFDICFHFSWVERLCHMVISILSILKTAKLLPEWPFCAFPPPMYKVSNFSTSLPTLVIICLLDYSYPSRYEIVLCWSFDLHFPND